MTVPESWDLSSWRHWEEIEHCLRIHTGWGYQRMAPAISVLPVGLGDRRLAQSVQDVA